MKKIISTFALACLVLPTLGHAQSAKLQLPEFAHLADKATESVNISISPWLLRTAAMFIDAERCRQCCDQKTACRHQVH